MRARSPLCGVTIRPLFIVGAAVCTLACLGEGREQRRDHKLEMNRSTGDESRIAARIDGRPLYLEEVEHLLEETDGGLTPQDALQALINNELLYGEAFRRRFDDAPEVELERRVALARTWLRTQIEEGITEDNFDEERLQKAYLAQKERYNHGVLRRVSHVVVRTNKKGDSAERAEKLAWEIYGKVRDETVESEFLRTVGELADAHAGKLKVESLPPFPERESGFARPFVEAVFSASSIPAVLKPQQTKFGWHVIFIAEQLPAIHRSFEQVRDEIARELLPLEKKFRAEQHFKNMRAKADVFVYENHLVQPERSP